MIKFRMYFDKDKEAQWLNEMANEGWAMKRFFAGVFVFEPCEKGQYQYEIDFCDENFKLSNNYKDFMAENDIEVVQTWGFWAILRKETAKGDFVLYSDVDSQIEQCRKINRMFRVVTLVEFLALLYEIYAAVTLDSPIVWAVVFFVMAIVIVFINQIVRTQNTLNELEERKTGIKSPQRSNISVLLMVGMLFNSCALVAGDHLNMYIKPVIQVLAIIFMLAGVIDTCRRVKR